jgi:hypothetical protein
MTYPKGFWDSVAPKKNNTDGFRKPTSTGPKPRWASRPQRIKYAKRAKAAPEFTTAERLSR